MGRKPIGEKKLPNTEKWKHYQDRKNSTEKKSKDKLQKQEQQENLY